MCARKVHSAPAPIKYNFVANTSEPYNFMYSTQMQYGDADDDDDDNGGQSETSEEWIMCSSIGHLCEPNVLLFEDIEKEHKILTTKMSEFISTH